MISFFRLFIKFIIFTNLFFCLTYENKLEKKFIPYEQIEQIEIESINPTNLIQLQKDTKIRKGIVTYYYADELIRKKIQWKNKEDYEIQLKGNAVIIHEKTKIFAPFIVIDPENNAKIKGKITVIEEEQGISLTAIDGEYSRSEEKIRIANQPYMQLRTGNDTILVVTNEITRDIAKGEIIFKEYIKMFGNDWTLFGDESIYYDKTKTFVVPNYPVILGKDIYLSGEKILYESNQQKIVIDNEPIVFLNITNSHIEDNTKKKNKTPKEHKKELMTIHASTIEYVLKKDERKGIIKGNVKMESETKKIYGEEFLIYGNELEKLESKQKVSIEDRKENFYLESNYMLYDLKERKLYLKNRPRIFIYNDDSKQNIKEELYADVIERDFKNEITIAKGRVWFKRGNEIAEAEYALIDDKKEIMQLTGNPKLKRNDTEIQCKRIDVYKDKIELQKEIEINIY